MDLPTIMVAIKWDILCLAALAWLLPQPISSAAASSNTNLLDLEYRVYPVRSAEEAAVIEWGHSAIISALDASVAHFGPQTSQAALLEIETAVILADPVDGKNVEQLRNADEIFGKAVIMTDTALHASKTADGEEEAATMTGVDLAILAQKSGAAALIVVNLDEDRPDDIYRLEIPDHQIELASTIDIPVVVISLNSANVLATANSNNNNPNEPPDHTTELAEQGMPDRIRLYAGGDRPFFEDVEAAEPTIYVIHNLLTEIECKNLIERAKPLVQPVISSQKDPLQLTLQPEKMVGMDRIMLWQGVLQGPERKAIEERIEQVTGFPANHFSEWIVDRISPGGYWQPHYDTLPGGYVPMASITVFLNDPSSEGYHVGGELVFPKVRRRDPVKIQPVPGMAVVHHNTNEKHQFETHALHALLPLSQSSSEYLYVARKYVLPLPVSTARRIVLPIIAVLTGGRLPKIALATHDWFLEQFGVDNGGTYFDKFCIFVPALILLGIAQLVVSHIQSKMAKKRVLTPPKGQDSTKKTK